MRSDEKLRPLNHCIWPEVYLGFTFLTLTIIELVDTSTKLFNHWSLLSGYLLWNSLLFLISTCKHSKLKTSLKVIEEVFKKLFPMLFLIIFAKQHWIWSWYIESLLWTIHMFERQLLLNQGIVLRWPWPLLRLYMMLRMLRILLMLLR